MSRSNIYVESNLAVSGSDTLATRPSHDELTPNDDRTSKTIDLDLSIVENSKDSQQSISNGNYGAQMRDVSIAASGNPAVKQNKQLALSMEMDVDDKRARAELILALSLMFTFITIFVLGRMFWDERYYNSDEGLGYWLGLVGGSMMLIAYCYTAFKYVGFLRARAVMKYWLTIHIIFGVAGPLLILFHSTFHLQSLNGTIAFIATVLVFASGVMARYVYATTHNELGDHVDLVVGLKENLVLSGHKIKSKRLDRFTENVLNKRTTLPNAIWDLFTFGWRARWVYFRLSESMRQQLKVIGQSQGWDKATIQQRQMEFKDQLREYIFMLKKVTLFGVYERFFSFWRNAHVPLLYLLLMSGIVHVVAVHMY